MMLFNALLVTTLTAGVADESASVVTHAPLAGPLIVNSAFGERRRSGKDHSALDLRAAQFSPVFAIAPGFIFIGHSSTAGNYVRISRGADSESYMHLDSISVGLRQGQALLAGQQLGVAGHSGFVIGSPGDHLHLEVRRNNVLVDPEAVLENAGFVCEPTTTGVHDSSVNTGSTLETSGPADAGQDRGASRAPIDEARECAKTQDALTRVITRFASFKTVGAQWDDLLKSSEELSASQCPRLLRSVQIRAPRGRFALVTLALRVKAMQRAHETQSTNSKSFPRKN